MTRVLAICLLLWPAAALAVDEGSEKSLFFAGRCMAQMLNGASVDVGGLEEMPADPAQGHLFGSPGQVFYGHDDSVVLVLHKDTNCGVNAFDEPSRSSQWARNAGMSPAASSKAFTPQLVSLCRTSTTLSSWP